MLRWLTTQVWADDERIMHWSELPQPQVLSIVPVYIDSEEGYN